jgi:hypothetical protein
VEPVPKPKIPGIGASRGIDAQFFQPIKYTIHQLSRANISFLFPTTQQHAYLFMVLVPLLFIRSDPYVVRPVPQKNFRASLHTWLPFQTMGIDQIVEGLSCTFSSLSLCFFLQPTEMTKIINYYRNDQNDKMLREDLCGVAVFSTLILALLVNVQ